MGLQEELDQIRKRTREISQLHYDLGLEEISLEDRVKEITRLLFDQDKKELLNLFAWKLDSIGGPNHPRCTLTAIRTDDYDANQHLLAKAMHIGHDGSLIILWGEKKDGEQKDEPDLQIFIHDERTELRFANAETLERLVEELELRVDCVELDKFIQKAERWADEAASRVQALHSLRRAIGGAQ